MTAAGAAIDSVWTPGYRQSVADIDRMNGRVLRVARLAKTLMAAAPFYDAGLPMEHRPVDSEGHVDLALAVAFCATAAGGRFDSELATLHRLPPAALHAAAPKLVVRAWRRLCAQGPGAECAWHRSLAMQIECVTEIVPRRAAR